MDPNVETTPASVSLFKSGKGHCYKMTFNEKPYMSHVMVKDQIRLLHDSVVSKSIQNDEKEDLNKS